MFKYIQVENFRGIKSLKIEGFKRINVLVGPNNSGKTTILESLFMLLGMSNPQLYLNINGFRQLYHSENNDFRLNFNNLDYKNSIKFKSYIDKNGPRSLDISPVYSKQVVQKVTTTKKQNKIENSNISDTSDMALVDSEKNAIGLNFDFKKSQKKYHCDLILGPNELSISSDGRYKEDLSGRFFSQNAMFSSLADRIDQIQREKKKDSLIKILKKIEPNILDVALSKNRVIYIDIGIDQMIPINIMGYGFSKVCALVANLLVLQDGYYFIDEIENGLHHETQSIVWKAVIEAAIEFNVQIFLTTHSYEALETLLSVIRKNSYDQDDTRVFLIQKLRNNAHKSYSYDFESLQANINNDAEIRGTLLR